MNEIELRDSKGKVVAMGSQDLMFRYVKNHVPDGDYTLTGPGIDLILVRKNGIVFLPAGWPLRSVYRLGVTKRRKPSSGPMSNKHIASCQASRPTILDWVGIAA